MNKKDINKIYILTEKWLGFVIPCNEDAWSDSILRDIYLLVKPKNPDKTPLRGGKRAATRLIKANVIKINEICRNPKIAKSAEEKADITRLAVEIHKAHCLRFGDDPFPDTTLDHKKVYQVGDKVYLKGSRYIYTVCAIEKSTGERKGYLYRLENGPWPELFYQNELRPCRKK